MNELTEISAAELPQEKIRYLMGVGTPSDLVNATYYGIDMFDCVIPTRSARFGRLFTKESYINIKNSQFRTDEAAVEPTCEFYTCKKCSRA